MQPRSSLTLLGLHCFTLTIKEKFAPKVTHPHADARLGFIEFITCFIELHRKTTLTEQVKNLWASAFGWVYNVWVVSFGQTELLTNGYSPMRAENHWALHRNGLLKRTFDCLKRMWSFSWDKHQESCKEEFFLFVFWSSSLTLLDGRAGTTRWIALHCLQMFVIATVCTQRQTHAVTFRLCSSIVVAVFVTFWNYVFMFFWVSFF